MKNLYEFLEEKYSNYERKDEVEFDEFIGSFLDNTFSIYATHEAFADDDFLGEFEMDFEIDHEGKEIKLLFK